MTKVKVIISDMDGVVLSELAIAKDHLTEIELSREIEDALDWRFDITEGLWPSD